MKILNRKKEAAFQIKLRSLQIIYNYFKSKLLILRIKFKKSNQV